MLMAITFSSASIKKGVALITELTADETIQGIDKCLRYLSLPPTRQDLIQGQWPEGRLKVGIKGGEGRAQAMARTLLVIGPLSAMWAWWA